MAVAPIIKSKFSRIVVQLKPTLNQSKGLQEEDYLSKYSISFLPFKLTITAGCCIDNDTRL